MIWKCLYVDLSNVFGGMCELLPPGTYLDFSSLLPLLNTLFGGIGVVKVFGAYMAVTPKESLRHYRLVQRQRLFFDSARQPPIIFTSGYISKHGQKKEIDMQLGVDMVHDAHQNHSAFATQIASD